jgi:tRNA (guanine10-N2)-dimethyltransferase
MFRSLVLLSGEGTTIPAAEAKALFLAYDPEAKFDSPEKRVIIVESKAEPGIVARRIAFARRVGLLLDDPADASGLLKEKTFRLRAFRTTTSRPVVDIPGILRSVDSRVDLVNPDFELTVVDGEKRYFALTVPRDMNQGWSLRRPRRRAYFHPSAIFPKLSRALVNLTRCREDQVLLDPFAGTGSILLEAAQVGTRPIAVDQTAVMSRGSLANMKKFGQSWLGVIRADAFAIPLTKVDAIATDAPYGRASSTRGSGPTTVVQDALEVFPVVLKSGCRMVMMHPKDIPVQSTSELVVEEEHHLYVHKRLTRAITVLRRR